MSDDKDTFFGVETSKTPNSTDPVKRFSSEIPGKRNSQSRTSNPSEDSSVLHVQERKPNGLADSEEESPQTESDSFSFPDRDHATPQRPKIAALQLQESGGEPWEASSTYHTPYNKSTPATRASKHSFSLTSNLALADGYCSDPSDPMEGSNAWKEVEGNSGIMSADSSPVSTLKRRNTLGEKNKKPESSPVINLPLELGPNDLNSPKASLFEASFVKIDSSAAGELESKQESEEKLNRMRKTKTYHRIESLAFVLIFVIIIVFFFYYIFKSTDSEEENEL